MLRMSKLADYGTVVMTSMARAPDRVHSAADVALRTGLALPTVSKLLKALARNGLLVSLRGARGGYMLVRAPHEISVAQVIAAIEGQIGVTECSSAPGLCTQESGCSVRANWQRINHMVLRALQQITLEHMTQPIAEIVDLRAISAPRAREHTAGASVADRPHGVQT
jgi:FeS assembly SUF system regulator